MAKSEIISADMMATGLPLEVLAVNCEIARGFDRAYPS
jgi:hypothetical protein